MINEERIKNQTKRAIAKKPTHIALMRKEIISNGMKGGTPKEIKVAELDIFFDDFKHYVLVDNVKDSGVVKKTRGLNMIAVTEGFEILEGDYFIIKDKTYRVTYVSDLVRDVYNADLEVIR